MKIRGHETFYIRKGWLYKGLKNVKTNPIVFTNKKENPMDVLGIGSNMVKALRYWMQAVGLTVEPKSGIRSQSFTELAELIWENDRYLEELGTLYLLHYYLVTNKENATSWYYFFNEFTLSEFKKEDFVEMMMEYIRQEYDAKFAQSSYEDDFTCLVNTYVSRFKVNPVKLTPESNMECPFTELGLVDLVDKKERIFRKTQPPKNMLSPLIVLAVILDQAKGEQSIHINDLLKNACNVGMVFNLDIIELTGHLYKIEKLGHIKVVRTAGLDLINITTKMDFLTCIQSYYESLA